MITLDSTPVPFGDGTYKMELSGNSEDEKPIGEYEGMKIANSSTFFTMDKADVNFYDFDKQAWV